MAEGHNNDLRSVGISKPPLEMNALDFDKSLQYAFRSEVAVQGQSHVMALSLDCLAAFSLSVRLMVLAINSVLLVKEQRLRSKWTANSSPALSARDGSLMEA